VHRIRASLLSTAELFVNTIAKIPTSTKTGKSRTQQIFSGLEDLRPAVRSSVVMRSTESSAGSPCGLRV